MWIRERLGVLSICILVLLPLRVTLCKAEKLVPSEENKISSVSTLTKSNFSEFIQNNSLVLVSFYSEWCPYCKQLAPVYEEVVELLKQKQSKIQIAKVDAVKEQELAEKYEIQGYPTFIFFRDSKPEEYDGGRSKTAILEWLEMATKESPILTETKSEADKLISEFKSSRTIFYIVLKEKTGFFEMVKKVALENRKKAVFIVYIDNTISEEIVTVHRVNEPDAVVTIIPKDEESFQKFVTDECSPWFGEISAANYRNYISSPLDIVWFLATNKDKSWIFPVGRAVGKSVRGKANACYLDADEFKGFGERAFGVKQVPLVIVQTKTAGFYVYRGDMKNTEEIIKFFEDAKSGKLNRDYVSDPVPESNNEPVKVVVAKSFRSIVLNNETDVLLEIYAPWCGHCKKLEPIYKELAEQLASVENLVIAKIDGTSNEINEPNFEIAGYPTIFMVPAGEEKPIAFNGERNVEELTKFIKEHSKKAVFLAEEKDEL